MILYCQNCLVLYCVPQLYSVQSYAQTLACFIGVLQAAGLGLV